MYSDKSASQMHKCKYPYRVVEILTLKKCFHLGSAATVPYSFLPKFIFFSFFNN